MANPERIREWLQKMQYPEKIPTNEELQSLCTGIIGPVFQQIIDKVKPKDEIDNLRKNLIINRISKKSFLSKVDESDNQYLLYENKENLNNKIKQITDTIETKQENFSLLKTKINEKSAKTQIVKQKIKQNKREETLLRAKYEELSKELEKSLNLNVSKTSSNSPTTNQRCTEKINHAINLINAHIDKNDVTVLFPQCKKYSSVISPVINTSALLYSIKKPLTVRKNRKNIFESVNVLLGSSCLSTSNDNYLNRSEQVDDSLESVFVNDTNLQGCIDEICSTTDKMVIWERLNDIKMDDNGKFKDIVSEPKTYESRMNEYDHMEIMHHCHIENELIKTQSKIKQKELVKKLEVEFENNSEIDECVVLEAMDNGLNTAISVLKSKIDEIKFHINENSNLDDAINKLDATQIEMVNLKTKIEKLLTVLPNCNTWIDKSHRNVQEIVSKPFPVIEEDIIDGLSFNVSERFCNLPINCNETIDSWSAVCGNSELLEIIETPNVFTNKIITDTFANVALLEKLRGYEKEMPTIPVGSELMTTDFSRFKPREEALNKLLTSIEANEKLCKFIDNLLVNDVFKISLNHPFNEFVSSKRLFNGKPLVYYVDQYDNLYKQLSKN